MVTQNLTLDGSTDFTSFDRSYSWSDRYIERVSFDGTSVAGDTLNLTMSGDAWQIRRMTLGDGVGPGTVTLTDTDDGIERRINIIEIGDDLDLTATLFTSRVKYIDGGTGNLDLTLGSGSAYMLALWDNESVNLTLGSGGVDYLGLSNHGTNVVNVGSSYIEHISMGDGNNTFIGGTEGIGTLRADGKNTITLSNGADTIKLGDGINRVTSTGDSIRTLNASGNNTISLTGDASIYYLKMDRGINQLTSQDGNIESIYAYAAQNTLKIGAGGVSQVVLGGSAAAQVVQSEGYLGSLQVNAVNQADVAAARVTTGSGGAGYIRTSYGNDVITGGTGKIDNIATADGNDTVNLGTGGAGSIGTGSGNDTVNANKGFTDLIKTGEGNDLVTIGADGGHFVMLEEGDDTASITAIPSFDGLLVDGGIGGSDTIDLSRFTKGLTVSLDQSGNFQEFYDGSGFFLLFDFENAIGSAKADTLTGSDAANRLTGALGSDVLNGLAGDDRLTGGKNNDTLTGGAGSDDFIFVAGDGSDRITDFTLGEDQISIAGARKLADITFTKVGANVDVGVGALHILVEDMTVADMRVAANFLF